jgi:flagellar hook-basal body complex protein FliE
MMPLSAIPAAMPAQGIVPRTEITLPGLDLPLQPGQVGGATSAQPAGESFGSMLGRLAQDVNASQATAKDAVRELQSGGNIALHQAVIAMEEASVSFQLMVEVRNKLLEAYQEIMRMQV